MKTLLDELKSTNNSIFQYVHNRIMEIEPLLNEINKSVFKEYTDHTKNHSVKVLELATRLNASNKLNMYELAVFILSSFYHDIGMFVKQSEMNEYTKTIEQCGNYEALSEDITTIEKLRKQDEKTKKYFLALDHFRAIHSQRSYAFISKKYPKTSKESFCNGLYLWDAVKRICYSHTIDIKKLDDSEYPTNYSIGDGETIDLLYLSLLLRLSDICHFSQDRAFPYFFRLKNFISKKSESIWKYYADVVDTFPNIETNLIEVKSICKNFYNHRAIIEDSQNIQKELENCHLTLAKSKSNYQFPWKIVTVFNIEHTLSSNYEYYNTKFRLDYTKIVNLLMGDKLYHDSLFSIRECIQNSLDSINVYCKKTMSNEGYILIDYKYDSENDCLLDIYDTGTGMDKQIINEYFLSVGSRSFWYSNRCFDEWGITKANTRVIADHGIGVLSYFMIASELEVFSIYQKTGKSIHVDIENYQDGIVFHKTPIHKFPVFESSEATNTPWDMNHGTCIRFHLKEKLQENVLLKFLAKHILRSERRIILNFPSYQKELDNIWHYRNSLDTHCYSKESSKYYYDYLDQLDSEKGKELDVESLYKKLYEIPHHFYNGPPNDLSISDNFFEEKGLRGTIDLNYNDEDAMPCRITQSGILVENAIDFILKKQNEDSFFIKAFGFDIDLNNHFQFQLDAERTRIIESDYNTRLFENIYKILLNKYYDQIAKIKSSIFFPCGGVYYHGLIDVLLKSEEAEYCFHKNFRNNIDDYAKYDRLNFGAKFDKAKLYMVGVERNSPISIIDIKAKSELDAIIILNESLLKQSNEGVSNKTTKKRNIEKLTKALSSISNLNKIIYLPLNTDSFLLPLYDNFDFSLVTETTKYRLLKIEKKSTQSIKNKMKLFESLK